MRAGRCLEAFRPETIRALLSYAVRRMKLLRKAWFREMKEIWNMIQLAFVAIGGWFGWFLGGFDGFLYALVVFMAIDYLTGLMAAVVEKKLCSEVGFRGIFKKVLIFLFVGIGSVIDKQIIGEGSVLRTAVIFFYISNEGISILENALRIGLPIPQKLRDALNMLKSEEEGRK